MVRTQALCIIFFRLCNHHQDLINDKSHVYIIDIFGIDQSMVANTGGVQPDPDPTLKKKPDPDP